MREIPGIANNKKQSNKKSVTDMVIKNSTENKHKP
jgi:hypothetical protein